MVQRAILICIILITKINFSALYCQSYASLANINYAQELYDQGNYESALTEYLRCNYFRVKSPDIDISKRISDLLLQQKDYKNAIKYLDRWYFENINDEEKQIEASIAKSRIYTLTNDFNTAIIELLQVPEPNSIAAKDRINYYLFINYLLANQVSEAEKYGLILSYLKEPNRKEIQKLLNKYQKIIDKNPNSAIIFSSIIPGLGQALHGNVKDGLISLAVVGGLVVLFVDVSLNLSFADAGYSVAPWLIRYHIGGLTNAKKQAKKNIEEKKLMVISEINRLIMESTKM
jgi:tetratricopeptide (TPR) repeat protein